MTRNRLCPQALEWIHDTGEFYLSTHTSTGSSIHHTQELLKEHEDFQITAKVCVCVCVCLCLSSDYLRRMWGVETRVYVYICESFRARCVLCFHRRALLCEAHSRGNVLSRSLIDVWLLLCWRTSYCVRHTTQWFLTLSLSLIYLSSPGSLWRPPFSLYPLPKCLSIESKPKSG